MAVKLQPVRVPSLGGLDLRIPAAGDSCSVLTNWTVNPRTGGWDNRIGWEKFFSDEDMYTPFESTQRIDGVYCWAQHGGALTWYIYETGGTLYYLNDHTSVPAGRTLQSGRTRPRAAGGPTVFVPAGPDLVIFGGGVAPFRYRAWPVMGSGADVPKFPFGWSQRPPAPSPWRVDTSPNTHSTETGEIIGIWADSTPDVVPTEGETGLGYNTALATNKYRWKVAYISNTGSESPTSAPSDEVTWTTPETGDYALSRFVPMLEVPVGPDGTVARVIYRTKNLGLSDEDQLYYFAGYLRNNHETVYYDATGDTALTSEAPGLADSVPLPALDTARSGALHMGCMFVATDDGLFYSLPGKIEQFRALDYLPVGGAGGAVRGLAAHYGVLLVMRERSIDYVVGDPDNGFQLATLIDGVGSSAVLTVAAVPPLGGLLFLAADGVYLVRGGTTGGAVASVERVSDPVSDVFRRMNTPCLARACGAWSQKWREYHVYFAADGKDRPNIGLVWHADKNAWSLREGFPVGCLTVTPDGDLVFGHHTGGQGATAPVGLFVISRRQQNGHSFVNVGTEEQPEYETRDGDPLTSTFRTAWQDFGAPESKKRIAHVDLYALVMGDGSVTATAYRDYGLSGSAHPAVRLQPPDDIDHPVYGVAVAGTSLWQQDHAIAVRIPLHIGQPNTSGQDGGAGGLLAVELSTTAPVVLTGYALEAGDAGFRVYAAKTAE